MKTEKGKQHRRKDPGDIMDWMSRSVDIALWLLGLSIPCFVFGHDGWGFALLIASGLIVLLLLAVFFAMIFLSARFLKHIPHR